MKIYYNNTSIDVALEDDAKVSFELMGENVIQLHYQLPEWVEIPVGATIEWQGKEYVMYEDMEFTKNGTRSFDYQLKFYPAEYRLKHWKMRNPIDNRLQYTMSLSPKAYVTHIVEALNKRDSGWRVGECIDAPEQVVAFDHSFIWDSLIEQAEAFSTEMEIIGKTIHLRKIEKNKDNPLPLAYGKGNGFVPGVGRKNTSDKVPFSTLYVQGGEQNINYSTYGSRFLLLPKNQSIAFDGEKFGDEEGFNSENSRIYISSADGLSIKREGLQNNDNDDSLDLTTIYPNRLEEIVRVDVVDESKNWYDIVISAPENLDYRNYQIGGETANVVFQSGMLGGKTFDIETNDNGVIICNKEYDGDTFIGWKLQLVPTEIDGYMMPGEGGYIPAEGDTLRLFGITLPQEYICDNVNKSGASWEMFREAVKYMYDNEDKKFTFTGELQPKWVRENYLNVMGYLEPGSYILFRDEQFDREGVRVRVTGVSYPLNNPYEVELTISNEVEGKTAGSALRGLEQEKIKTPAREQNIIQYTQRGFRDLKETTNMLSQAVSGFDEGIKPVFVETMQTIVGDERLQYVFVDSLLQSANQVSPVINYDNATKQITMPQQYIQHRTLGITDIAPKHEYKMWQIASFTSAVLADANKAYYMYIRASKSSQTANMSIGEDIPAENARYYYLLFAIINKENNGTRSIVTLNGYTEVLPGRITTDKIVSASGDTYFDLVANEIGGRINFKDGLISGLVQLRDKDSGDITAMVSGATGNMGGYLRDVAFASGVTNAENDAIPTDAVVALTHKGYGSKIGILSVEDDAIVMSAQDNSRRVVITYKSHDDYKGYSVKNMDVFELRSDGQNPTPVYTPLGDTISDGHDIALDLLRGNISETQYPNGQWVYLTNSRYSGGSNYKDYATKRTYTTEVARFANISKSGNYDFAVNLVNTNKVSFAKLRESNQNNGNVIAYAKLTTIPRIEIEKYDINGGYIASERVELRASNNVCEIDKQTSTTEVAISQNVEKSIDIASSTISLTGGITYSIRLFVDYDVDYFLFFESRGQLVDAMNVLEMSVKNTQLPRESNAVLQAQQLVISPDGIKFPNGSIMNGN